MIKSIEVWYNPYNSMWGVQALDERGQQVDTVDYERKQKDALTLAHIEREGILRDEDRAVPVNLHRRSRRK